MNKLVKSFALIGFVFLYIFAVTVNNYVAANSTYFSQSSEHSTGYFKEQPSHLFSHTNQSLESICNFISTNFPEPKKLSKTFLAVIQVTDNILDSKFVQYSEADTNFPLKFTKQDIIYPFHYFL